jgi:hypothetical protein
MGRLSMAIGTAVQKGGTIHIYDPKGNHLGSVSAGGKPPDGLVGFTNATVSVRRGSTIHTYDERGNHKGSIPAR